MSLTPVDVRHQKLGRRLFGYDRKAANRLLAEVAASFEETWRERADLRDEVERLEGELARYKEVEGLLRDALVTAERTADDVRAQAHRAAELIVEEARAKAREVTASAESERERVRAAIRRLKTLEAETKAGYRAFLVAALARIEDEAERPEQRTRAA